MAVIIGFDGKNIYTENKYNYPVVTNFTELETAFVQNVENILRDCFNPDFPIRIEQRSQDYLSMMVGEHSDFLRFKCTERTKWFTVCLSPIKRKESGIESRFDSCKPTIIHWKIKLKSVDDLINYSDIIQDAYLHGVAMSKI